MFRPLSPHLLIYKYQLSSILSIFHRSTGILLAFIFLLCVSFIKIGFYLFSFYPLYFFVSLFSTTYFWFIVASFILFFSSFFLHLFGGIRHLIWDGYLSYFNVHIPFLQSNHTFSQNGVFYSSLFVLFSALFSSLCFLIFSYLFFC